MMRFKSGDTSIPATFLNDVARVVELPQNRQRGREATLPEGIIYIQNTTGTNLDRFAVLGISNVAIAPADNAASFAAQPVFVGIAPTAATITKFCVLRNPIANNAIGQAFITGVFSAIISVVDEAHIYAGPSTTDASKLFTTGAGGAQIIWKESGTGDKWAVLRMGAASIGEYSDPHIIAPNGDGVDTGPAYTVTGVGQVYWYRAVPPTGTKGARLTLLGRFYDNGTDKVNFYPVNIHLDSNGGILGIDVEVEDPLTTEECS